MISIARRWFSFVKYACLRAVLFPWSARSEQREGVGESISPYIFSHGLTAWWSLLGLGNLLCLVLVYA